MIKNPRVARLNAITKGIEIVLPSVFASKSKIEPKAKAMTPPIPKIPNPTKTSAIIKLIPNIISNKPA